jgi:hypothetical protein
VVVAAVAAVAVAAVGAGKNGQTEQTMLVRLLLKEKILSRLMGLDHG